MTASEPSETIVQVYARQGYIISMTTALITIISFGMAITTPPLSGPFCTSGCFEYPYSDIASRFPGDYLWMYPTMLVSLLFILFMVAIHLRTAPGKKLFSLSGISLAILSAAVLVPNYFVQVTVIQPSLLRGETEGIALISQFNPHGIFIAMEEAGFFLMNIALLVIAPAFRGNGRLFRVIRITGIISFLLAIAAMLLISVKHGVMREYYFEVAIISIVWIELIIISTFMTLVFRREMK